jgi:hypothetical protein
MTSILTLSHSLDEPAAFFNTHPSQLPFPLSDRPTPLQCPLFGRFPLERTRGKEPRPIFKSWPSSLFPPSPADPSAVHTLPHACTPQHRHHRPMVSHGRHPPSFFSPSGGHPNLGQQGCDLSYSLGCAIALPYPSSPCARSRGKAQLQKDTAVLDHLVVTLIVDTVAFASLGCTRGHEKLRTAKASR